MIIFSIFSLDRFGDDSFITTYIIVSAIYIPGIIIYLYYWAASKNNRNLYIPHSLTVSDTCITSTSEGNVYNELPLHLIIKTVERKSYWLLYIARSQFIYIPKNVFSTAEDLAEFRKLITSTKN
jgi:hypothetical protein